MVFQCHVGKWEGDSLRIWRFCSRGSEPGQVAQVEQRHLIQTELLETRQVYKKAQECLEIKIIKAITKKQILYSLQSFGGYLTKFDNYYNP